MNLESIQQKASEVAKEDFEKYMTLAKDAASSGAYLFPLKGIFYFVTHRALWKPLLSRLVPTLSLSLGVVVFMFLFTYLPQVAILTFVNGPLAAFTTVLLVLSESSTLVSILSRSFLLDEALLDVFDGTLLARNESGVVAEGRELKSSGDPISKLGKLIKSPFQKYSPKSLIRYIMYLPLNFIPVVGTVLFVLLQGRRRGPASQARYFQLKKWSKSQQQEWVSQHSGAYTSFGTIATLLEMVPIVNILFTFTNTVGAALWAADIEKNNTQMKTDPALQDAAKKTE